MPIEQLKKHLSANPKDKAIAVLWGLVLVFCVLLAIRLLRLDSGSAGLFFLDDTVFGYKIQSLSLFYVLQIVILLCVVRFLQQGKFRGIFLLLPLTVFNFVETGYDLFWYGQNPHLLLEEAAFLFVYLYLGALSISYFLLAKSSYAAASSKRTPRM